MFLQQNVVKHSLILIIFYYFDLQKFITISQASETLKHFSCDCSKKAKKYVSVYTYGNYYDRNKNYLPPLKQLFNSLQFMSFKQSTSKLDRSVNDFPDCTSTN